MKSNNVVKPSLKIPIIIMCILSVICLVACGVYAYLGEGSFKAEKSRTLTVTDISILKSRGKNIANDTVLLANDIHVSDASFCVGDDAQFMGIFDGCGHTVYIDYSVGESTTSFFSAIGKNGVIKNTRFVFTNVSIKGENFSGIAKINYGLIQDCLVEYNLQFNAKEGMFTPFIGVNNGSVKNIVTRGTFRYNPDLEFLDEDDVSDDDENTSGEIDDDNSDDFSNGEENDSNPELVYALSQEISDDETNVDDDNTNNEDEEPENENFSQHSLVKNDDEKKIAFASTCIYNYGELKNIISKPRFVGFYCTNRDNYLAGRSDNVSIASICAFLVIDNKNDNAEKNSGWVTISEKTLYTSDDAALVKYEQFATLIFDVNGALDKTLIENTYDFNNTVWEVDEDELYLKLIVK